MKIAVISDLHIDINRDYPVMECLADIVKEEKAELLLIAGDISEHADESIDAIRYLETLCGFPVYYVPGNHDMWSENFAERTTDEIYTKYAQDERCLVDNPQIFQGNRGKLRLVGDIGWYDYSYGAPEYPKEELAQMKHDGRTWQDSLKNQWTADNCRRTQIQLDKIEKQLQSIPEEEPVIVVTHMIPVREFCVPEERVMWKYFNAFLGSEKLGELFEKYQVAYSVSGHVHYRKKAVHGKTTYLCPCLGYHTEWPIVSKEHADDLAWQIRDALAWIEL